MKALLAAARLVDRVSRSVALVATWLVLLACLVSATNATIRYAADWGSNAWLELQWYLFAGIVMLGAANVLHRNEHVRVDILFGRLSRRAQIWVDIIGSVVFLLPTCALIGWMSWPFFAASWSLGEMSSNSGGLILWPAKILLPIGFGLLALQALSELVKRIAMLTGDLADDVQYERPLQ